MTDVVVFIGSLGDDVTGDHDVIGCPIYVTSSQAKNGIMDFFSRNDALAFSQNAPDKGYMLLFGNITQRHFWKNPNPNWGVTQRHFWKKIQIT